MGNLRHHNHLLEHMKHGIYAIVFLWLSACSPPAAVPTKTPHSGLEEAIEQDLARSGDEGRYVLRHNPVVCNCPPFELELGARWVRVALTDAMLVGSPAARLQAQATVDTTNGLLTSYPVQGTLSTDISRCGQGAPYLTLTLETPTETDDSDN